MSTDIAGGLRLLPGTNVNELLSMARPLLDATRDRLDREQAMDEALASISDREVRGEPLGRPLYEAISQMDADMTASKDWAGRRCRIFHKQEQDTGVTYMIVRGNRAYAETMLQLASVEDFSYWSSEEPDGFTRGEWLARRDQWNALIPGNPSLADIMTTWHLRDDNRVRTGLLAGPKDWKLPTTSRRAIKALTDVAFGQTVNRRTSSGQDIMSTAMSDLMDARELIMGDEAASLREFTGNLVATGDWALFAEGQGVSLVHSNLDRLNAAVARLRGGES